MFWHETATETDKIAKTNHLACYTIERALNAWRHFQLLLLLLFFYLNSEISERQYNAMKIFTFAIPSPSWSRVCVRCGHSTPHYSDGCIRTCEKMQFIISAEIFLLLFIILLLSFCLTVEYFCVLSGKFCRTSISFILLGVLFWIVETFISYSIPR